VRVLWKLEGGQARGPVSATPFVPRGAHETITSARLTLRRPVAADAPAILDAYAGDPEATRMLAWPRHTCLDDTLGFVDWSEHVWSIGPAGPYVILDGEGAVIGSTGLEVEAPHRAATGYVLARRVWGRGCATEAATAMAAQADRLGIARLYALCHPANRASARVLQKVGFAFEGVLRRHTVFPNLDPTAPQDVECWARVGPR